MIYTKNGERVIVAKVFKKNIEVKAHTNLVEIFDIDSGTSRTYFTYNLHSDISEEEIERETETAWVVNLEGAKLQDAIKSAQIGENEDAMKTKSHSEALTQLSLDLDSAYELYAEALVKKRAVDTAVEELSQHYKGKLHALVREGVPGNNAQERDAHVSLILADTLSAMESFGELAETAILAVKLEEIKIERLRAHLRILEALVKVQ